MSSTLQYRGYEGSVQYSAEDRMLHGCILCARDIVSYGGIDLADLETNFHHAVDEYLAFCNEVGKAPAEPMALGLELSLKDDLRTQAQRFAQQHDLPLDAVVNDALQEYLAKAS